MFITAKDYRTKVRERVEMLIDGKVEDPEIEEPMSKQELKDNLTSLILAASELRFGVVSALHDLGVDGPGGTSLVSDLSDAMQSLDMPEV